MRREAAIARRLGGGDSPPDRGWALLRPAGAIAVHRGEDAVSDLGAGPRLAGDRAQHRARSRAPRAAAGGRRPQRRAAPVPGPYAQGHALPARAAPRTRLLPVA